VAGDTPDLARQELWAYLIIYQAIRVIIARAAAGPGLDPDRISFTATLHAARRTILTARASMTTALAGTEAEILTSLVPRRDGRVCPRAVSKPVSPYPPKHQHTGPLSQHAGYTATITSPHTSTGQHKQPKQQPNNPLLRSTLATRAATAP